MTRIPQLMRDIRLLQKRGFSSKEAFEIADKKIKEDKAEREKLKKAKG